MDRLSRADLVVSKKKKKKKKKKGQRPHVVVKLRLQSPSKFTLLVGVQNYNFHLVLSTARRGQNNCAAAQARTLEGTLEGEP